MLPVGLGGAGAPLTVLALGAHCDDVEIGCGAALMRILAEHPGSRVHYQVFASNPERAQEARACAKELLAGAQESIVEVGAFRESFFPYVAASIKERFEELKALVRPDVVFTHRLDDMHQDHRVIAELTWNTFRDHLIAQYEIPKYEGDLGQPNFYVPLTREVALRKVELLVRHYQSQSARRWFRAETFEGLMRIRGIECNAPDGFAEAFHVRKFVL